MLLSVETEGAVTLVTLNRPEMRNALGEAGDAETFEAAMGALNADRSVRCVILTGAGSAFSAGGNIKAMREGRGNFSGPAAHIADNYRRGIHRIVRAVWGLEVPVIAAVNGAAIGLGNDIACLCDMRLAAKSAIFGATFLKLGLIPGDGGAWVLPRIIGSARAAELLFSGKLITADEAAQWGLVSAVVEDARLLDEARVLAEQIAEQPPESLRAAKRLMRHGQMVGFDVMMEMSANAQALMHVSEDHSEAVSAMLDKRVGNFKDR